MVVNEVRLIPGCRVFGSHRQLVKNPNASVKRRVNFGRTSKLATSRSLKLTPNDTGIPLSKESDEKGVSNSTI